MSRRFLGAWGNRQVWEKPFLAPVRTFHVARNHATGVGSHVPPDAGDPNPLLSPCDSCESLRFYAGRWRVAQGAAGRHSEEKKDPRASGSVGRGGGRGG